MTEEICHPVWFSVVLYFIGFGAGVGLMWLGRNKAIKAALDKRMEQMTQSNLPFDEQVRIAREQYERHRDGHRYRLGDAVMSRHKADEAASAWERYKGGLGERRKPTEQGSQGGEAERTEEQGKPG